ncbi:hypothetical protein TRVA0_035S00232 [Trichomonascus vanleenenianus]|uniref:putative Xaa-Pro dipeptidase n=1 Tax=Trichomonascus vanleenenianus TaxID=2268995 RepID=UPI003EC9DFBE
MSILETKKYPARAHAQKTAKFLKQFAAESSSDVAADSAASSLFYIESPALELWPHSDLSAPFRQSRYFMYLTGVDTIPACRVTYDVAKDHLTLYLPSIDYEDVMWSGMPVSLEAAKKKYDVDAVKYATDLKQDLSGYATVLSVDASAEFPHVKASETFKAAIEEARMLKDEYEIALMKRASEITDNSHMAVMSALPIEQEEGHIHAEFVYHAMRQGSKFTAYDPICCSGTDCGTLHYVKNDQPLDDKLLVLIDAGAEWKGYAADVTRTFPISGEWTKEARQIYETVQDMHNQTMSKVAPGTSWDELHKLSHKVLIKHFLELGIFNNGTEDEIFESRVSTAFYPHGLGHLLGLDTHDCGGKPNYEDPDPMLRFLRLRRDLQESMVVTVEPGCYFNEFLLEPVAKNPAQSKFLDHEVLKRYMPVGGVRIEDDVLVTATGFENLTKMTSDPDEVAKIVKDGINKGRGHFHVVV